MKFAIFFIAIFLRINCFAQSTEETAFKETVYKVIDAFSQQDSAGLSKLINPAIGVFHLYQGNTFLGIIHLNAVGFSIRGRFEDKLIHCKGIHATALRYTRLPGWDCDSEIWNKKGLFVDTTVTDHMLTKGATYKNKYEPGSYTKEMMKLFLDIETSGRRVVLQDKKDSTKQLVFYLTFMHNKWYLTIIDSKSSDCSV